MWDVWMNPWIIKEYVYNNLCELWKNHELWSKTWIILRNCCGWKTINALSTRDNSFRLVFHFRYSHVDTKKTAIENCVSTAVLAAWHRPTLPGPCGPSTIGARGLNGRVRDGYAWNPSAIDTKRISSRALSPENRMRNNLRY